MKSFNHHIGVEYGPHDDGIVEHDAKLWEGIRQACIKAVSLDPLLEASLQNEVLKQPNLESCLSQILAQKMSNESLSTSELKTVFDDILLKKTEGFSSDEYPDAFDWPAKEGKWDMATLIRADLRAVKDKDPACIDAAQPLLYLKGFQCLQVHRIAHVLWKRGRRNLAFFLQSRCSEKWAMDIHPAAVIGKGVMFDHGTGVVGYMALMLPLA